ncbi:MAG: S-adenosylmethionine decarboxylase [Candidatus Omnitrophica bacterium]|nr:S-adenosylmethionine decarboxylase [Candidatus Omnitrophota bacterium]
MVTQKYLENEESVGLVPALSAECSSACAIKNREFANGLKRRIEEMEKKVFGYELVMDLSDCDLSVMSSKKKLAEYVDKLCRLIKMKKYGKVQLPYFGLEKPQTKGYSLLQFIETSSITGHFSEYWRKSYINIFSCKPYNHRLAANFTKEFFGSKHAKIRFLVR